MTDLPPDPDGFEDVPLSALMQKARQTYLRAAEREQRRVGCEDLTPTGSTIVSTMLWADASLEAVVRWMGVSKQAVSQTVDLLVERGYLVRTQDRGDRRKVRLQLTDRGRRAGAATRDAIDRLDARLLRALGRRRITATRSTLVALVHFDRTPPTGSGLPGSPPRRSRASRRHVPSAPRRGPSSPC